MATLKTLQRDWEGFAQVDPLWAICVDPARTGNRWTQEEFFATGKTEIGRVMDYVRSLGLTIERTGPALDFGCGVGRLTRALAEHFPECWGVDISPTMVRLANEFNQNFPGCHFLLNDKDDLSKVPDGSFGFIYSSIVLQHIKPKYGTRYLLEFCRLLRPGGVLVFQAVEREFTPLLARLRDKAGVGRRLRRLLGRKNIAAYRMAMYCFPEKDVRALFAGSALRILDVRLTNSSSGGFNGDLRFLEAAPTQGFVSKQYCLLKGPFREIETCV